RTGAGLAIARRGRLGSYLQSLRLIAVERERYRHLAARWHGEFTRCAAALALRGAGIRARRFGLNPQDLGRWRGSQEIKTRQRHRECSEGETTRRQGYNSAHGTSHPLDGATGRLGPKRQTLRARPTPRNQ